MNTGVDIALMSHRSTYLGALRSAKTEPRVARLRAQLAAADDPAAWLPFARAAVDAKLRKQSILLQRLNRRDTDPIVVASVNQIDHMISMIPQATDREGLMGLEGAAARAYFVAVGCLIPEPLRFAVRSRRPPQDLINAALSFGYALLLGEATAAAVAAGLEPNAGSIPVGVTHRSYAAGF